MTEIIAGRGGDKPRTPVEAPNTLRSKQHVRVLHVISEGEIDGLIGGHQGIFFDDVPLMGEGGEYNYTDVLVEGRTGTQWQDAISMVGVESEVQVGVELKQGIPIARAVTDFDVDSVRITVSVPQLSETSMSTGDIKGASVGFEAEVKIGSGAWQAIPLGLRWIKCIPPTTPAASTGVRGVVKVSNVPERSIPIIGEIIKAYYEVAVDVSTDGGPWVTIAGDGVPWASTDVKSDMKSEGVYLATGKWFSAELPAGTHTVRARMVKGEGMPAIDVLYSRDGLGRVLISGKTMSRTQLSYNARLPEAAGQERFVRLTRLTPDSESAALQNRLWFDSFTLQWDERLRYPNTAMVATSFDAQQFSSIPAMGFLVRGIKVLIPSNYDPIQRTYTGSWDGTFTRAWSNNPAWVWYDILTNTRYGLGGLIDANLIDKWSLYNIAQYCDERVPDSYGGWEPRFTCNVVLSGRQDAWRLVNDLLSVFRAIGIWAGGALSAMQDAPRSPRYLYSNATVVGGDFAYQSVPADKRYNVAAVTWHDPAQQYRQSIEVVERPELIARWGSVQQSDIVAVGCTSRGQARRIGRWLLYAETEAVSFSLGADGALPLPGDIIEIADAHRAGARNAGRLLAGSTATKLLLDAPIGMGGDGVVSVMLADGSYASHPVAVATGATEITVSLASEPLPTAPWAYSSTALATQMFRVVAVAENTEDGTYAVSAVAHDPDKFAEIEYGTPDVDLPTSLIGAAAPDAVKDIKFTESLYDTGSGFAAARLTISWASSRLASRYTVEAKRPGGNWELIGTTQITSIDINSAESGLWTVRVTPTSIFGRVGHYAEAEHLAVGLSAAPEPLTGLRLDVVNAVASLSWDAVEALDVKLGGAIVIRHSRDTAATWDEALPVTEAAGRTTSCVVPLLPGKYLARAVDSSGIGGGVSEVWSDGQVPLADNWLLDMHEHPAFAGAKTNATIEMGSLRMGGSLDALVYRFAAPADLGYVYACRLTANIAAVSYDDGVYVDYITDWDASLSIDGESPNHTLLSLWVRTSDDNVTWSAWKPFVVGDYLARAFEFELRGRVEALSHWIYVSALTVTIDMPDRIASGNDIPVPATGLSVVYDPPYAVAAALSLTAQGLSPGDWVDVASKTASGFTVYVRNAAGTAVSGRIIDYIAKGY